MVVVVDERDDDPGRAVQRQARADVDGLGAGGDEAVDEVLREVDVDLLR